MDCPKCKKPIEDKDFDVNVEEVEQENLVEVQVLCPHCKWTGYNYLHSEGFLDMDPETAA